jgi:hypothetical protein
MLAILSVSASWSDLLLLQLKRPICLRHRLQNLRVLLQKLVVDAPEASNELIAAATSTAIISYMEGNNVARKSVAVEVHCCRDLRSSKSDIFGPNRHDLLRRIANMAYGTISIWPI